MSTTHERGTSEWFKSERQHLINWAKAVDSFAAAARSFRKLVELGLTADSEVRAALLSSGVINYGRPFKAGSSRFQSEFVKDDLNFNEAIHAHLITLRDKLIAHSDPGYADARVYRKFLSVEPEDMPAPAQTLIGASVLTRTVHAMQDMDLGARCVAHVEAAERAAYAKLAERLQQFTEAGQDFPEAFEAAAPVERSEPIRAGEFRLAGHQAVTSRNLLLNPLAVLKAPPLEIGRDGYAYRGFGVHTDIAVKVRWRTEKGQEGEVTWEVRPSAKMGQAPQHDEPHSDRDTTVLQQP
jgi:hypothetical protein